MVVFIHLANGLYVASYLVKDILWLRVFTVLGGLVLLAYYSLMPTPLWAAIAWNVLFLTINLAQIRLLLLERRPVRLEPDEMRLYQLAFRSLTLREFAKLIQLAQWKTVDAGERIVRRGEALDTVMVLVSGRVRVEIDGAPVRELSAGRFVGEMSFLTGKDTTADVVTIDSVRAVSWPQRELRALLSQNAELRAAVQMVIGEDVIAKLRPA
jgi:hypothetical protein